MTTDNHIERSLAIVIGINQYKHIRKLKSAVHDAEELAKVLKERYQYEVLLLTDDKASKEELLNLLKNLQENRIKLPDNDEQISVKESDRVLFYFAGHGIAEKAEERKDKDVKPAGYLMLQDSQDDEKSTWLSMQELHDALTDLNCRHLLMILDCCFAGGIRWAALKRNSGGYGRKMYQQSYDRFIKFPAQQVITSAAHDEQAQDTSRLARREGDENRHSPFADLLLKVLKAEPDKVKQDNHLKAIVEDGVITAQELFTYLQNRLGNDAEEQTPELFRLKKHDKGEYIFLPDGIEPNLEKLKLDENTNPYKGLASFEKEDSQLFFGRKRLIEEPKEGLLKKVSDNQLTVVLGLSGSGKSSLVKAGLIPALISEKKTSQEWWYVLDPMRPGDDPLTALATTIHPLTNIPFDSLIQELQQNKKFLTAIAREWSKNKPNLKLLLTIDQCEELITLCKNEERATFLQLLAEALASPDLSKKLRIVITLRSDFEPQIRDAIKETRWQDDWQNGRFIVTPMNREELQQAIEEPAAQRALFFESPKLVNQLIDEVVQMPGALPLLSFTLSELYLKYLKKAEEDPEKDDRTITEEDYENIGGVTRSLTNTADKTHNDLVEKEKVDSSTIRDIMLRMVAISGGESARRRVPTSELVYPEPKNKQVQKVIHYFLETRLLIRGLDAENQEYIEPAHDALVKGWVRLKEWIDKELDGFVLRQRLTAAANDWAKNPQDSGLLLPNGDRLNQLEKVLKSENSWFNQQEAEFVERSIKKRREQERQSLENQVELNTTESQRLFTANDRLDAIAKMIKAGELLQENLEEGLKITQHKQLHFLIKFNHLLSELGELNSIDTREPIINFSSNQKTQVIATVSGQNSNRVCFLDWKGKLINVEENEEKIYDLAFSPDGDILVTGGEQGIIKFYKNDRNGWHSFYEIQGETRKHRGYVNSLSFSPDGNILVSASNDGKINFWSREGAFIRTLITHPHPVLQVAFSPTDNLIAFTDVPLDKDVKKSIINILKYPVCQDGEYQVCPGVNHFKFDAEHEGNISAIDFSPDGKTLVSGGRDGKLQIWTISEDLSEPGLHAFREYEESISHIAFSPDGKIVASSHSDGIINFWNLSLVTEIYVNLQKSHRLAGHKAEITKISFTSDSSQLLSSSYDGTVKLWYFSSNFEGHSGARVQKVSFSTDNQIVTTVDKKGNFKLWNFNGELQNKFGDEIKISDAQLSRENKIVVAVGSDGGINLYSLDGTMVYTSIQEHQQAINLLRLSPIEDIFVTTSEDNRIDFWKINRNPWNVELLKTFNPAKTSITAITFSGDGKFFASGSDDGKVELWSLALDANQVPETIFDVGGSVVDLSLSNDGQMIGVVINSTTDEYEIKLCSRSDGSIKPLRRETKGMVYALKVCCEDEVIVSISETNKIGYIEIWNIDGSWLEKILALDKQGFDIEVEAAAFSPNKEEIALATYVDNDYDGYRHVQTLNLSLDSLMRTTCERIQDYLELKNIN